MIPSLSDGFRYALLSVLVPSVSHLRHMNINACSHLVHIGSLDLGHGFKSAVLPGHVSNHEYYTGVRVSAEIKGSRKARVPTENQIRTTE